MEYSPMMVVMLWALTPSDASDMAAHVQEMPTPGMTVHQESYFTFNHGKPFVAEQDPLTGAILNLKTTPISQDDYLYDEDESDGIDRKDGPKVFTRNDIIQPSKDPDLHKFLNLPVHYSSSGKFPLISSSYANTKIQGHGASASNHRPEPTSSTTTVSPSYYPLKTSPTTSGTTSTTTTTTTPKTTTTVTTTTTLRPSTTRTTTTTTKPPPAYEYEYEYDYDREPEPDKKTTTQKILEYFDKDYAFLGASEEEHKNKNSSKVEYIMPTQPEKHQEGVMISSNSNIFIPPDYLKPTAAENSKETIKDDKENKNMTKEMEYTSEVKKPSTTTMMTNESYNTDEEENQTIKPVSNSDKEEENMQFGIKSTNKIIFETTTPKLEETDATKKVPFFPTVVPEENESMKETEQPEKVYPVEPQKPAHNTTESKPTVTTQPTIVKPLQFHHPYLKPQDILSQQTRPSETIRPYNPYSTLSRPFQNSDVPPEMMPPNRPTDTSMYYTRPHERPISDSYTYRPVDPMHLAQKRPQSNRPIENMPNKPIISQENNKPLDPQVMPTELSPQGFEPNQPEGFPQMNNKPIQNQPEGISQMHNKPTQNQPEGISEIHSKPTQNQPEGRPQMNNRPTHNQQQGNPEGITQPQNRPPPNQPQGNTPRPDPNIPVVRPIITGSPNRPSDPMATSHNRPYEGLGHRLETPHSRPTAGIQNRPQESHLLLPPQRPNTRPTDLHYPSYVSVRPGQDIKPEQRPFLPEYRPPAPRPDVTRPTGFQEYNVGLGSRVPDNNKNKPENPDISNNKYQVQFTQPSKVENHFIKVSPGQENPSYSLQTSFSIGVPPPDEVKEQGSVTSTSVTQSGNKGVGQVLFPDEGEKRPFFGFQEEKRPPTPPLVPEGEKYPRPPWESHLKPPLVFNHLKKDPFPYKRVKPTRPDLPNILPQFRPNAKIGHGEPHVYMKTPYDTLQPPPLPRPQFLRAEPPIVEEEVPIHRRNGQTTRVVPVPIQPLPIQPIVQTPKRGSLRSEDEKTDPVFVVYPTNNAQDGVVVGTRGPQRPLPPDNLDIEDAFPLDTNKNFQARVDTPILKGKPTTKPVIKNEFPYPLVKPTEVTTEEKPATTVTKEYTAFSPTISPTEKEHDTEINLIPYLQDYMPFATKKPSQEPPAWNIGDDIKPISVTLKTQKEETTTKIVDNHKSGDTPTPQDFQAPFHASLSAPSQGWSVVRPRPEPEKETETTTTKPDEEQEGKFDIQNFKPQLFGGFKPIIPPIEEIDDKKPAKEEKE